MSATGKVQLIFGKQKISLEVDNFSQFKTVSDVRASLSEITGVAVAQQKILGLKRGLATYPNENFTLEEKNIVIRPNQKLFLFQIEPSVETQEDPIIEQNQKGNSPIEKIEKDSRVEEQDEGNCGFTPSFESGHMGSKLNDPFEMGPMKISRAKQMNRSFDSDALTIDEIPPYVLLYILSFVKPREVFNFSMTAKILQEVCRDKFLWQSMYRQKFRIMFDTQSESWLYKAWKTEFENKYRLEKNFKRYNCKERTLSENNIEKIHYRGSNIAAVGYKGVFVWDLKNTAKPRTLIMPTDGRAFSCYLGPNNQLVTGHHDGKLSLWDLNRTGSSLPFAKYSNEFIGGIKGKNGTVSAIQAEGSYLVSGGSNGVVSFWDLDNQVEVRRFTRHNEYIVKIQFNETTLLSASYDGKMRLFDVRTAQEEMRFKTNATMSDCQLIQDLNCLIAAGENGITKFDTRKGNEPIIPVSLKKRNMRDDPEVSDQDSESESESQSESESESEDEERYLIDKWSKDLTCVQFDATKILAGNSNGISWFDTRTLDLYPKRCITKHSVESLQFDDKKCIFGGRGLTLCKFDI